MYFIPSPIQVIYDIAYLARANASGRMQYYRIIPGKLRERIGRAEFIKAFNTSPIVAIKPIQIDSPNPLFQMEFFVKIRKSKVIA